MFLFIRRRLPESWQCTLAALSWAKAYRRMAFHRGIYMFLIQRMVWLMSEDWIYDYVSADDVESMNRNADRLERNMRGGIRLTLNADNESAVDLCRIWRDALQGDRMAWVKISSFVAGIVDTVEAHLDEEGINPYEAD
jgi:hypothetical protein